MQLKPSFHHFLYTRKKVQLTLRKVLDLQSILFDYKHGLKVIYVSVTRFWMTLTAVPFFSKIHGTIRTP